MEVKVRPWVWYAWAISKDLAFLYVLLEMGVKAYRLF